MRPMKRIVAALAALTMMAGVALAQAFPPGPWLPITNITANTGQPVVLDWDDFSNLVGVEVWATETLDDPDWTLVSVLDGSKTVSTFALDSLGLSVDSPSPSGFFRLRGVRGDGSGSGGSGGIGGSGVIVQGSDGNKYMNIGTNNFGETVYIKADEDGISIMPPTLWVDISNDPAQIWPSGWNGVDHTLMIDLDTYAVTKLAANFDVTSDLAAKTDHLYLRYVKPGNFTMGNPSNEMGHVANEAQTSVTLTQGYYIGVYEVTEAQYAKVTNSLSASTSARPQVEVSWNTIRGKTATAGSPSQVNAAPGGWLATLEANVQAGPSGLTLGFELPTEAQWEFACRAGTIGTFSDRNTVYAGSGIGPKDNSDLLPTLGEIAWFASNDGEGTGPGAKDVGLKDANPAGLYDMHGNVYELCRDAWDNSAPLIGGTDPLSTAGSRRAMRGGNYNYGALFSRSAYRGVMTPHNENASTGFRLSASKAAAWQQVDHTVMIDLNTYAVTKLAADFDVTSDPAAKTDHLYLRHIKPGSFTMGNPVGEVDYRAFAAQTSVTFTRGYYIGVYTVTEAQYQKVTNSLSRSMSARPQTSVSWNTIRGKTAAGGSPSQVNAAPGGWLATLEANVQAGPSGLTLNFELPTEAQWEFACRAGTIGTFSDRNTVYAGSGDNSTDNIDMKPTLGEIAWYTSNDAEGSGSGTKDVGLKLVNLAGLYDMHGNVYELCRDAWDNSTPLIGGIDPLSDAGSRRAVRGGAYSNSARLCRSAWRSLTMPVTEDPIIGFRLCTSSGVVVP